MRSVEFGFGLHFLAKCYITILFILDSGDAMW